MAIDKALDSTQLDTDLTSVANAIRTKGGTSASLAFPADFVSAINAISGGGGGVLPDSYQEVEYIESTNTGNGPYLKMPYIAADGHKIKVKSYITVAPSSGGAIVTDCVNNNDLSRLEIGYSATQNLFYFWSNATVSISNITNLYGEPIESESLYKTSQPYRTISVKTSTFEDTVASTDAAEPHTDIRYMYVFAKTYRPFAGRVYYVKVESASGLLALDLVPCYRKSDSVIGMYDLVQGIFYQNAGSGTFTKGQDVLSAQQALNVLLGVGE